MENKKTFNLIMPEELHRQAKLKAIEESMTLGELFIRAILVYIEYQHVHNHTCSKCEYTEECNE